MVNISSRYWPLFLTNISSDFLVNNGGTHTKNGCFGKMRSRYRQDLGPIFSPRSTPISSKTRGGTQHDIGCLGRSPSSRQDLVQAFPRTKTPSRFFQRSRSRPELSTDERASLGVCSDTLLFSLPRKSALKFVRRGGVILRCLVCQAHLSQISKNDYRIYSSLSRS